MDERLPDLTGRRFLLLQGPQSGFFAELGDMLLRAGAEVHKVNFCGGDVFLWGRRPAYAYRGDIYHWPAWVGDVYRRDRITDVCLYGDWRPRHWEAVRLARVKGIRVWVFEEGYLRNGWSTLEEDRITDVCLYGDWRPRHWEAVRLARVKGIRVWVFEEGYLRNGWSTLEENGVNGRSMLPATPHEIHEIASCLKERTPQMFENDIRDKVMKAILHHVDGVNGRSMLPATPHEIHEIASCLKERTPQMFENDIRDKVMKAILHHVGNTVLWPWFHHYRTHRPTNIVFLFSGPGFIIIVRIARPTSYLS